MLPSWSSATTWAPSQPIPTSTNASTHAGMGNGMPSPNALPLTQQPWQPVPMPGVWSGAPDMLQPSLQPNNTVLAPNLAHMMPYGPLPSPLYFPTQQPFSSFGVNPSDQLSLGKAAIPLGLPQTQITQSHTGGAGLHWGGIPPHTPLLYGGVGAPGLPIPLGGMNNDLLRIPKTTTMASQGHLVHDKQTHAEEIKHTKLQPVDTNSLETQQQAGDQKKRKRPASFDSSNTSSVILGSAWHIRNMRSKINGSLDSSSPPQVSLSTPPVVDLLKAGQYQNQQQQTRVGDWQQQHQQQLQHHNVTVAAASEHISNLLNRISHPTTSTLIHQHQLPPQPLQQQPQEQRQNGWQQNNDDSNTNNLLPPPPTACTFTGGCSRAVYIGEAFCTHHGTRLKKCTHVKGCKANAIAGGPLIMCKAHGGGRRCLHPGGCKKPSISGGKTDLCMAHGGGKRCGFPGGCQKHIVRLGLCQQHGVAAYGSSSFSGAVKPRRTRTEMAMERMRMAQYGSEEEVEEDM